MKYKTNSHNRAESRKFMVQHDSKINDARPRLFRVSKHAKGKQPKQEKRP